MDNRYHPMMERTVDFLVTKTQSSNHHFYRLLTCYYFAKMASMLRTNIQTKDRGIIPINLYILNLMESGSGKGFSTGIFEEHLISGFKTKFMNLIFPGQAEIHLIKLASDFAIKEGIDEETAMEKVAKDFESLGPLPFSFDAATGPALKQLRQKILMASTGSMNIEIDEIGHNLLGNGEALTVLYELYDRGLVKPKLTKNTKENIRLEEIEGFTPTNLSMYGTPVKLFDGSKTEEELMTMLSSGYARRLLFGYSESNSNHSGKTAEEIYIELTSNSVTKEQYSISNHFTKLATSSSVNKQIDMQREISIDLIQYKLDCERKAEKISKFDETGRAQMIHRYFNVLKLSGAYAFIDGDEKITSNNLNYAIELIEDSGSHFNRIQQRDANYIRLAKYLAHSGKEVTTVDLINALPFYKGTKQSQEQLMTLAITWGYKNNIIIKRTMIDEIEFMSGESLKETDIDELILSHSTDITTGYTNEYAPFSKLNMLTKLDNHQFCIHHLEDGYRIDEKVMNSIGFNLCVIDVDGGTQVHVAEKLLSDYTYLIYHTKSSTDLKNRFRLILPLSHHLKLGKADFKQFMRNVYEWLPFEVDTATCDRVRKWATCKSPFKQNIANLLDATKFIPRTNKAIKQNATAISMENMSQIERWFAKQMKPGQRNNILLRYGLVLLDSGMSVEIIRQNLFSFNSKMDSPVSEMEIMSTVMSTVNNRAGQKSAH